MVWYGTLLGRRDKIYSTAIKGKKKKEIASEDALTLFYQLFFQEEGILLFWHNGKDALEWKKVNDFFLLDESKGYTYPFSFLFFWEIFFDKKTLKRVFQIYLMKNKG